MIRDFNSNWLFQNKNGIGRTVHLPHDAMMEEERTAMCHNGTKTGYYPGGKYIYTKALSLTEEDSMTRMRLSTDAP